MRSRCEEAAAIMNHIRIGHRPTGSLRFSSERRGCSISRESTGLRSRRSERQQTILQLFADNEKKKLPAKDRIFDKHFAELPNETWHRPFKALCSPSSYFFCCFVLCIFSSFASIRPIVAECWTAKEAKQRMKIKKTILFPKASWIERTIHVGNWLTDETNSMAQNMTVAVPAHHNNNVPIRWFIASGAIKLNWNIKEEYKPFAKWKSRREGESRDEQKREEKSSVFIPSCASPPAVYFVDRTSVIKASFKYI